MEPKIKLLINKELNWSEINKRLEEIFLRNDEFKTAGTLARFDQVKRWWRNEDEREVEYLQATLDETFTPPGKSEAEAELARIAKEYGIHTFYAYVYEGQLKPGENFFVVFAGGPEHRLGEAYEEWHHYLDVHIKKENVYK